MRYLLTLSLLLPLMVHAQDYTMSRRSTEAGSSASVGTEVLVVPLHPHYIISEVDRMLAQEDAEVMEMRDLLLRRLSMEVTRAISDSLDALDLSIAEDDTEEIPTVEYVHNALDYRYQALPEQKENRFSLRKLKPKEKELRGAYSTRKNGQLDRVEILEKRYMGASFGNEGALDYLQDLFPFENVLVISQLELRRNTHGDSTEPYLAHVHYQLMNDKGAALHGGIAELYLSYEQMQLDYLKKVGFQQLAQQVFSDIWEQLNTSTPVVTAPKSTTDY